MVARTRSGLTRLACAGALFAYFVGLSSVLPVRAATNEFVISDRLAGIALYGFDQVVFLWIRKPVKVYHPSNLNTRGGGLALPQ